MKKTRGGTSGRRRVGKDIYFTNLPELVRGGFHPAAGIGAGWIQFEYELNDFGGNGLSTGSLSPAGELVLDLKLSGWYLLHFCHSGTMDVWLDGEKGARLLDGPQGGLIRDFPLHTANLTGRKLHIAPKRGLDPREVTLFYIRAEPCKEPGKYARNLVATEDGDGLLRGSVTTSRDIYRFLTPYRDSNFFRVLWGVYGGGDLVTEPGTKYTVVPYSRKYWFYGTSDRFVAAAIRNIRREGQEPLAVAVKAAHDTGMEIHFYFRVGGFYGPFPHHGAGSRFYKTNQRLHCRDEFGKEVKRISYAYPETQDHILSYLEHILKHRPDGICLAFNRGLPLMICEEPVLREFKRRHGRAPRLPQEVDSPELLVVRQEMLADFIARVQAMLARYGKALSCIVPRNFRENRLRGLDIEMCVKRGLFESVHVGAGHEDNPAYTRRTKQPPINQDDLKPVLKLKSYGTARIYLGGCAGHGTFWPPAEPATRARRMLAIHKAGLDGAYFWDTNQWFARDWENIRHYGDRRYVEKLASGKIQGPVGHDTLRIHDLNVDRYNPWNAY